MKTARSQRKRLQDEYHALGNLKMLEAKAILEEDGHLTIMRFTTHWKGMLGTPNLDDGSARTEIWDLPCYESLEDLVEALLDRDHDR